MPGSGNRVAVFPINQQDSPLRDIICTVATLSTSGAYLCARPTQIVLAEIIVIVIRHRFNLNTKLYKWLILCGAIYFGHLEMLPTALIMSVFLVAIQSRVV